MSLGATRVIDHIVLLCGKPRSDTWLLSAALLTR